MVKIGRNEKCPCQSGKKFKHCCAGKVDTSSPEQLQKYQTPRVTLTDSVAAMQEKAVLKQQSFRELGVFFLFSTNKGDAWLLEMTDSDCIQIARDGQRLENEINETPETIEVNWTYQFAIKSKVLELTAYADKQIVRLTDAPSKEIAAAMKRIHKRFTPQQLRQVHIESDSQQPDV